MRALLLGLTILVVHIAVVGQVSTARYSHPPPGGIHLLPGYVHVSEQGIDTSVGTIAKEGGLHIRYDIGSLAGNYADPEKRRPDERVIWSKTQKLRDLTMILTLFKGGSLVATFRETCANFLGSNATTDEQIIDFVLMISTYHEKPPNLRRVPKQMRIFYLGC